MPAGNQQTTIPAPIRTNTNTSDTFSTSSTLAGSDYSTTSPAGTNYSGHTNTSAAEKNFFGALTQKIRDRSRSRSRSRTPQPSRNTAGSPTSTKSQPPTSPMSPRPYHAQRQASESSTASANSTRSPKRTSTSGSEQTEWEKFTYGRHSNDWLFGGFSVKDTASRIIHGHRHNNGRQ